MTISHQQFLEVLFTKKRRRQRVSPCFRRYVFHCVVQFLFVSLLFLICTKHGRIFVDAVAAPNSRNNGRAQPQQPPPPPPLQPPAAPRIFEVFETEEEEKQSQGEPKFQNKAWLTSAGKRSPSPTEIVPPKGWEWASDWKIDIGGNRDPQGWEYVDDEKYAAGAGGELRRKTKRTRRWLRSMQPQTTGKLIERLSSITTKNETVTTAVPSKKRRFRARDKIRKTLEAIDDDFNFKGFGWTFYKSLLHKYSCGIQYRIPITLNFDSLDRRPHFPVTTLSGCLFYPWTGGIFVSTSLPCEYLRHLIFMSLQYIQWVVLGTTMVLTGFWKKVDLPPIQRPPIKISANVQERIGFTFSWRISEESGYEFRKTSWYLYLPTLEFVLRTISLIVLTIFTTISNIILQTSEEEKQSQIELRKNKKEEGPMLEWLKQHVASLGLNSGYPTPHAPGFSFGALLSLSGFYYSNPLRRLSFAGNRRRRKGGTTTRVPARVTSSWDYWRRRLKSPATAAKGVEVSSSNVVGSESVAAAQRSKSERSSAEKVDQNKNVLVEDGSNGLVKT